MKVKKVSGSYRDIAGLIPSINTVPNNTSTQDIISQDIPRTPFIGSLDQQQTFNDAWLKQCPELYNQGDTMGGAFIEHLYTKKMLDVLSGDAFLAAVCNKKFSYSGYLNDCHEVSGVCFFELKDQPSCWIISIISNANASIDLRQVTLFFSEQAHESMGFEFAVDSDFDADLSAVLKLAKLPEQILNRVNKIKMATQLALLKNTIKELAADGQIDNAAAILKLVDDAKNSSDDYFSLDQTQKQQLAKKWQQQCGDLLKATKPLMPYYSWDRFFINLLLFVLLLGVIYLAVGAVKYLATGRFLLYSPVTPSEQNLTDMEKTIELASMAAPG